MKHKIGFIGLGLIGGSIARAVRQYFPDCEIAAFDKNKETLALATQESVIDVAATTIDDNFKHCNYLFLCAPVSYNTAYLKQVRNYLHSDCILTDVGSVKTDIHREVEALAVVLQPPNRYIKSKPFHFPHCRNFFMSSFMHFYVVLYCVSRETMV